jgi:hypothetical protein
MLRYLNGNTNQKNSPLAIAILIFFFVGCGLTMAAMDLYDHTVMSLRLALTLWIAPGLIATPFLFRAMQSDKYKGVLKAIGVVVGGILCFGSIVLYGVLAINFYKAADAPVKTQKFPIIESGALGSQGRGLVPFADIRYKDEIKRFTFSGDLPPISKDYRFLQLEITPGYFAFDVIKGVKLLK